MLTRSLGRILVMLAIAAGSQVASAQPAPSYTPPKTSWGAPDLQGVWNNASLTAMERPETATKLVVSADEAAMLARRSAFTRSASQDSLPSRVDDEASRRLLADKNPSRAYNSFWLDPGSTFAEVKGEYRTSWIIEPGNGRIPWLDAARAATPRAQVFDGPEARPQSERCLMSFTGSAGPVMTNGLYNNNYQIVQTPDSVMIMAEMIHEVRIIPLGGPRGASSIAKWGGNSAGRYEGDTLVVETVNPNPKQRSYITSAGKLTERFTRWSDDQILYQFTVEDPTLYRSAWKGEMAFNTSKQAIYEYACHEGNYALPGILTGARELERQGRAHQPVKELYAGIDVSEGQ